MKKLSSGKDSTLGNYIELVKIFFGEDSKPYLFLLDKIKTHLMAPMKRF